MLALPIFTASHPATIVGADELNFCVRDGNRWTLIAINTNYLLLSSSGLDCPVNFFIIPRFSFLSSAFFALLKRAGDPYRIRTDVNGVRGHCLNHLTNGPCPASFIFKALRLRMLGPPSRTRTGDPLIKSQLLYQLS